ncbi:MAG: rRNA pseudouridine synthase [Desulfobulbaceae bacterium]|nr:rRNA pseudouridine synthase [Desulfobulbaceae bacterium]
MHDRLQKILARAGIASRRKAEELITKGHVSVDGRIVTELGTKVDTEQSTIAYKGKTISFDDNIYILLNKPKWYLCTMSDPQNRPIVTDLLKELKTRVFPVGRLDYDSEGALILTNDGRLGHYLQHPSFEINKTYKVTVTGNPSTRDLQRLRQGIMLEGRKTWPAKIKILEKRSSSSTIEVIIHEGKKRQVRKMFDAIGCPVNRLIRTAYGNLTLNLLPSGKYKYLTKKDLKKLFSGRIPFTINKITD